MTDRAETEGHRVQQAPRHIVLIGEMGAGKTTVGSRLAEILERPFLDSDELLQERTGLTGADLAESLGVEALHDLELEVFLQATSNTEPSVICPAASVLDSVAGREALRPNVVIWLDAPLETALERIGRGEHRRDVDRREAEALRQRRIEHYQSLSRMRVDTGQGEPTSLAAEIARALPGLR